MTNKVITKAITAVLALNLAGISSSALADNKTNQASEKMNETSMPMAANLNGMEKCYGIAKAGNNDCGTSSHNCAGESKINNDKTSWVTVPNGICNKIFGGSTTPIKS